VVFFAFRSVKSWKFVDLEPFFVYIICIFMSSQRTVIIPSGEVEVQQKAEIMLYKPGAYAPKRGGCLW
jgi:hypothetical protein